MGESRWHVVHTYPNREMRAANEIQEDCDEVYLPLEATPCSISRSPIPRPLFRNYIFARFDPSEDLWQPILHKSAVKALLGMAGTSDNPKPIPDSFITRVRAEIDEARARLMPQSYSFAPGDRIVVTDGHFASKEGTVSLIKASGSDRIKILLDAMGKFPLDVPKSIIAPATARQTA